MRQQDGLLDHSSVHVVAVSSTWPELHHSDLRLVVPPVAATSAASSVSNRAFLILDLHLLNLDCESLPTQLGVVPAVCMIAPSGGDDKRLTLAWTAFSSCTASHACRCLIRNLLASGCDLYYMQIAPALPHSRGSSPSRAFQS